MSIYLSKDTDGTEMLHGQLHITFRKTSNIDKTEKPYFE